MIDPRRPNPQRLHFINSWIVRLIALFDHSLIWRLVMITGAFRVHLFVTVIYQDRQVRIRLIPREQFDRNWSELLKLSLFKRIGPLKINLTVCRLSATFAMFRYFAFQLQYQSSYFLSFKVNSPFFIKMIRLNCFRSFSFPLLNLHRLGHINVTSLHIC